MSPVAPSRRRNPRSMVLAVAGIVLGIALVLVLFVVAIPSLTESGKVEVKLGPDTFDAGPAPARAASIRKDGPLLFSDVASGQRDIFIQHLGDDDNTGWQAFDARRPGTDRACTLRWNADSSVFDDPCDGSTVPADGEGLVHYPAEVTKDGNVVVDLNAARRSGTDASTTAP